VSEHLPITVCWHCDRPLEAATGFAKTEGERPDEGSVSLCLYCGAVAVFGEDLALEPPTAAILDILATDSDFLNTFAQFAWARQYVMVEDSLLRDRKDPDR